MDVYYEEGGLREGYPFEITVQSRFGTGLMALPHYHEFIEILYCQEGCFDAQLGSHSYRFGVGDMLFIPSREVHCVHRAGDRGNSYLVVKFVPALLLSSEQTALELQYLLALTTGAALRQRVFTREELAGTFVPSLFSELQAEQAGRDYGFEIAIRAALCRLFLWVLRRWHGQGVEYGAVARMNPEALGGIRQVFEYVERHYGQKLSMEEVAARLNMSYSAFSKYFTRHTGMSFVDYLSGVRLTKAKILLATTGMSITEIALEAGFSTTSYFIHCFKSRHKVTPQQFRRQFSPGRPEAEKEKAAVS